MTQSVARKVTGSNLESIGGSWQMVKEGGEEKGKERNGKKEKERNGKSEASEKATIELEVRQTNWMP